MLYDQPFALRTSSRGLDRLGKALFNQYLDRVDQADGLPALPLFLSLRAAIRAQVAVAARRQTTDRGKAGALAAEASRYLALACALLRETAAARLVACGQSGTGKSTLAYAFSPLLGRAPGARVLRSDVLRKRMFGVAPETRLRPEGYTAEAHAMTYSALAASARACLAAGQAVIADAVFADAAERAEIAAAADAAGAEFRGVWLVAPAATLLHRVAGRSGDASDATEAVVHAQLTRPAAAPTDWAAIDADRDSGTPDMRIRRPPLYPTELRALRAAYSHARGA